MITDIRDLAYTLLKQPSIVSIGVFDGVHRGHQHLIKKLVAEARMTGRKAVALTFYPHPDLVLLGPQDRYYLTTPKQRTKLLMDYGVDYVVTYKFNETSRQVRAADFVDLLIQNLKMEALWIGKDFAMGYKREGNVAFLQEQGQQKGFSVQAIELVANDGTTIQSSAIREALRNGQIEQANRWLGRAYEVTGPVVSGEKRGRKIGYPTANIDVWEEQVLPANGIYAGWARLGNERFMAMTNVGIRPTFEGDNVTVEAYLLDFDRDIYGEQIRLTFDKFLRPEAKFDSIDELVAQIAEDVAIGRAFLSEQDG